jgi:hypothetical protein
MEYEKVDSKMERVTIIRRVGVQISNINSSHEDSRENYEFMLNKRVRIPSFKFITIM